MVPVVVGASLGMRGFDIERIVISGEGAVHGSAPFPLEAEARSVGSECPGPSHILDASGKAPGRYLECQAAQEDFVAPANLKINFPLVFDRIERNRGACGFRGEHDQRVGHRQIVLLTVGGEGDGGVGEGHAGTSARDSGCGEVSAEPNVVAGVDSGAVKVRRGRALHRADGGGGEVAQAGAGCWRTGC